MFSTGWGTKRHENHMVANGADWFRKDVKWTMGNPLLSRNQPFPLHRLLLAQVAELAQVAH